VCSCAPRSIRFLQWNIERGYKLPGIIEELRRTDADVIALQARALRTQRSRHHALSWRAACTRCC
jgi:endonuclease/exonuclease/phosphatase family metal-dependent hydrolase